MFGPGEYVADQTEGITRVEDLPNPKLVRRSRNYKRRPCPLCEHSAYRLGFEPLHALCTTWETHFPGDHATLFSRIHSIAVPNAIITSMPTWTIWHYPEAIIPIEWSQWQYGLLLKTVYHTARHRGIYGVTIEYLCPGLRFKTGLKPRG